MSEEKPPTVDIPPELENGVISNHFKSKKTDNATNLDDDKLSQQEPKDSHKMQLYLGKSIPYLLHIVCIAYFSYATYHYIHTEQTACNANIKPSGVECGIRLCTGYGMLLILYTLVYLSLFYFYILKPRWGKSLHKILFKPINDWLSKLTSSRLATSLMFALVFVLIAIFLYFDTQNKREKLVGLLAPACFLVLGFIFSSNRRAIQWNIVLKGILGQFLLCLFCIRWEVGRKIFLCIGDKVTTFLNFALEGARFVYGDTLVNENAFTFSVLPTIFFISFLVAVLYYLGTMQWIILKLGWILSKLIGSTICTCVMAGANIFLGMSESSLLIQPYCNLLTRAEIHALMVSGFATVSGSVLAAYLAFGASASNLITSSVMAAPAAIGWAYLYWPETEQIKVTNDTIGLQKSDDSSLLEAAANGASTAIPIVLGIAANIVAIIAFVAFLNSIVGWLGLLVGLEDISFEYLLGKIFIPIAYAIGIPTEDCNIVGKVIASKTIINEFVAYERLGTYFSSGQIGNRSMNITTFAICGFANPSSIGILVGSLNVLAPARRKDIAACAFRAFVVGSIVCFVSASFAGILLPDEE